MWVQRAKTPWTQYELNMNSQFLKFLLNWNLVKSWAESGLNLVQRFKQEILNLADQWTVGKVEAGNCANFTPNMRHLGAYRPYAKSRKHGWIKAIPNHDVRASSVNGLSGFKMPLAVSLCVSLLCWQVQFANMCSKQSQENEEWVVYHWAKGTFPINKHDRRNSHHSTSWDWNYLRAAVRW